MTITYQLAGRNFQVMNPRARTFACDNAQMVLLQDIGLLHDDLLPLPDEAPEAYMARMNNAVVRSQRIPELIAHYLLPEGKTESDWTPAMAQDIAVHLAGVQDEAERELLYQFAAEMVFGFFRRGVRLLESSRSYLDHLADVAATPSNPETVAPSSTSSASNGRRSSGTWQRVITTARTILRTAGRYARA